MDPAIHWTLRAGLAALLCTAAYHKASQPDLFLQALRGYRILPAPWAPAAVPLIVAFEAGIAVTLLWPGLEQPSAAACAVLLTVYSGAIGANLARGRRFIDCGCLGPRASQPLSGRLLARNGVLIFASLAALVPPGSRHLTWVDGLSIAGGVCVLALLFHVTNLLAAQAAAGQGLGRST